jgi:excisionase family DNA binding protein
MEAVTFWREFEPRFEKLSRRDSRNPAKRLHATLAFHGTPEKYLDAESDKLVAALKAGTPVEVLPGIARLARWCSDKAYVSRWVISGGPDNREERDDLRRKFCDEAAKAARGADLVHPSATDDEAVDAWLDFLWSRKSPSPRGDDFWSIEDVIAASATGCVHLAMQADRDERVRVTASAAASATPAEASETARTESTPGAEEAHAGRDNLPADESKSLTLQEAAKALHVHEDTLHRARKRGEIEMFKVGRRCCVRASEVQRIRERPRYKFRR